MRDRLTGGDLQRSLRQMRDVTMIIARAPLRISLVGGGTDLPAYADRFGGFVISATINRYIYAMLTETRGEALRITVADAQAARPHRTHLFDRSLVGDEEQHLSRETFAYFGIDGGYRVFFAPELPAGLGLGSLGATTVALITAITAAQQRSLGASALAELACHVAIERLNMPVGRQDQFASAFGGLSTLTFEHGETHVAPCQLTETTYNGLQERLLLFITGQRRESSRILAAQCKALQRADSPTLAALHDIKAIAREFRAALNAGELSALGGLLDRAWQRKRCLAPGVSNAAIDTWYDEAKNAGALGGKITGAGGGGCLLLYAEPEARRAVITRMQELGLVWVDIAFERTGTTALRTAPLLSVAI